MQTIGLVFSLFLVVLMIDSFIECILPEQVAKVRKMAQKGLLCAFYCAILLGTYYTTNKAIKTLLTKTETDESVVANYHTPTGETDQTVKFIDCISYEYSTIQPLNTVYNEFSLVEYGVVIASIKDNPIRIWATIYGIYKGNCHFNFVDNDYG